MSPTECFFSNFGEVADVGVTVIVSMMSNAPSDRVRATFLRSADVEG